jgi:Na+-transporting NADH:ubiquinone oxidoreductase subunit NqrC
MSLISKALKKIENSRENSQEQKVGGIVYLTDAPKPLPITSLLIFLLLGIVAAILLSTTAVILALKNSEAKQVQVLNMDKTIKIQEKRINDLITVINKNQKFTDSQIRNLKVQINDSKLTDNDHYSNLKDAILNDKEEISYLDNYTKNLNQRIEAISVASTQTEGK